MTGEASQGDVDAALARYVCLVLVGCCHIYRQQSASKWKQDQRVGRQQVWMRGAKSLHRYRREDSQAQRNVTFDASLAASAALCTLIL